MGEGGGAKECFWSRFTKWIETPYLWPFEHFLTSSYFHEFNDTVVLRSLPAVRFSMQIIQAIVWPPSSKIFLLKAQHHISKGVLPWEQCCSLVPKSRQVETYLIQLTFTQSSCSQNKVGSQREDSTNADHTKIRQSSAGGVAAGVASLKSCQKLEEPAEFTWPCLLGWSWANSCTSARLMLTEFFSAAFLKKN